IIFGFHRVFEIETVADGEIANVALERDARRPVDGDPPGHGFVDRGIGYKSVGRRRAHHMEVNRIVADLASLSQLTKLDPLDLERREPLPHDRMAAKIIARNRIRLRSWRKGGAVIGIADRVAFGDNSDAAR